MSLLEIAVRSAAALLAVLVLPLVAGQMSCRPMPEWVRFSPSIPPTACSRAATWLSGPSTRILRHSSPTRDSASTDSVRTVAVHQVSRSSRSIAAPCTRSGASSSSCSPT